MAVTSGGVGFSSSDPAEASDYVLREPFAEATVTALRHAVASAVADTGMAGESAEDFILAVHELVTNAVRHGGGNGVLSLRMMADVLVCEVVDYGSAVGKLPVRLSQVNEAGGRGLWLAHQLTGSLMLTHRADGVTATVSACVTPQPTTRHQPVRDPTTTIETPPTLGSEPQ